MLSALSIRDIVLIERLDLVLEPGLTAFTGETGAGKSILLDALGLALGGRGDAGLVRAGAQEGRVRAIFALAADHPLFALLEEMGVDAPEPGEVVLERVQKRAGAARAFINGQPVAVSALRQAGRMLVEIHGQHDARALMDAGGHLDLLDDFGRLGERRSQVCAAWERWRAAREALDAARAELEEAERERDWLEHVCAELEELDPRPGEEEELAARRQVMMHAEQFASALAGMRKVLQADGSMAGRLNGALRRIERQREAAAGRLDDVCDAFDRVLVEMAEAESILEAAEGRFDFDARDLEQAEARLFALRAAARKHKVRVEELPALAQELRGKLNALAQGGAHIRSLEESEAAAREDYMAQALALSKARRAAARELDARVMAELAPLKLEKAHFVTRVEADEGRAGPAGIDRVEFLVATNPGSAPGPLAKIASGGEMSRFMLALKVALAEVSSAPVLVFDEIDTGVGGAVAAAMGERLARLAGSGLQVLTVTHSPQVAALADHHHMIAKTSGRRITRTSVRTLDADARREEIARMLSAHEITQEARAQAARLLEGKG